MVSSIPLVLNYDENGNIQGLKQATEISVGSITSIDFSVEGTFLPTTISATTISAVNLAVDNIDLSLTALNDVADDLFSGGDGKYLFVSGGGIIASSVTGAGAAAFTDLTDTPGSHVAGQILLDDGAGVIFQASTVLATTASLNSHTGDSTIHFTQASIDHGSIGGLTDNDHTQYTLSATNAALSSTVNSHFADSTIHFTIGSVALSDIGDVSSVVPVVGQVLTFGAGGEWAPSTSPVGVTDHGLLTGLSDNDHTQYTLSATNAALSSLVSDHVASASVHFAATSIDHNTLQNLTAGDVHTQYFKTDGTRAATGGFSTRDIVAQGTREYNTCAWNIVEASTVSANIFQINSGGFIGIENGESVANGFAKIEFVDLTGTPDAGENSLYVKEYMGGGSVATDSIHFHRDDGSENVLALIDADTTGVIAVAPGAPSVNNVFSTWNKSAIFNTFLNKSQNSTVSGDVTVTGNLIVSGTSTLSGNVATSGNINMVASRTVDGRDVSVDGAALDAHIASSTVHFTQASIDHGSIAGLADNDHPQYVLSATNATLSSTVSTHIADSTIHFTEASIDHGSIAGLGDNDHPQYVLSATNATLSSTVSAHITSASVHFTEASIDHGSITGLSDNDHPQYVLSSTNSSLSSLVNSLTQTIRYFFGRTESNVSGGKYLWSFGTEGSLRAPKLIALSGTTSYVGISLAHLMGTLPSPSPSAYYELWVQTSGDSMTLSAITDYAIINATNAYPQGQRLKWLNPSTRADDVAPIALSDSHQVGLRIVIEGSLFTYTTNGAIEVISPLVST